MTARAIAAAAILTTTGLWVGVLLSAQSPSKPGQVNDSRVQAEASTGTNWLVGGRTFDEQHFSPLKQITDGNVSSLKLAWALDIDSPMGLSVEPIVVDGVIYVSAPQSIVRAIDAKSGKVLWAFDPKVRLDRMRNSWSARTNRGVAVWAGKVYVGTGDCRLVAIDAASGKQVWQSIVCDATQTGITGAPHAGRGKVFIGYNGSDTSVRGSVAAFDAETGKEVWRFWTVPGDPSKPYESKALEMAAKTWSGDRGWLIGGGDVWDAITFDPVTNLVMGTPESKRGPARLLAFSLSGTVPFPDTNVIVPPVPQPPAQTYSPETIEKGRALYSKHFCSDCHSPEADGSGAWTVDGAIPDLRYMPPAVHRQWNAIVLNGSRRQYGMPGFGEPAGFPVLSRRMTAEEADAIHAYVIDLSWKAYNEEQSWLHPKPQK